MEFTAKQIGDLLNGEVEGNPHVQVSRLSKIEEGTNGSLTFLSNPKYESYIYSTLASAVVVSRDFRAQQPVNATLIKVDDAYQSFAKLLGMFSENPENKIGIENPCFLSPSASIGKDAYVGAFAYLGNRVKIGNSVKIFPNVFIGDDVSIGDETIIYAGAKIYSGCIVGAHCIIHSGVIIGADGFGFAPNDGKYSKVPQTGNVVVEDHVEIGANTTIDRATLGSTLIRKGVKLDNLIQIAHNVEIGENTVIAAQTGIAGSTKIGKNCMIGGQVGIIGHLTIADGVKIAAQSGIGTSITHTNEIVQGSPAFPISDYKRTYVVFKKLPEIEKRIAELEKLLSSYKPDNP